MMNTQHEFGRFMKKNAIFRFNFAYKDISSFEDLMGVKLNYYRTDNQKTINRDITAKPVKYFKLRSPKQEGEAVLCIINDHFIILKNTDCLIKCFRYALENIKWTPKDIEDIACQQEDTNGQFKVQFNGRNIQYTPETQMFEDTYIYDLETFKLMRKFFAALEE